MPQNPCRNLCGPIGSYTRRQADFCTKSTAYKVYYFFSILSIAFLVDNFIPIVYNYTCEYLKFIQSNSYGVKMKFSNVFKHLWLVMKHKHRVFINCCKCGIAWRGIVHDLSKFSPTEFFESVKYYQGNRSPIGVCRRTCMASSQGQKQASH